MITNPDIVNVMRISLHSFVAGARRTGRSERLLKQLAPRDVVICPSGQIATQLRRQLEELGRGPTDDILFLVAEPDLPSISERLRGHPFNKLYFDHTWIERYYEKGMDRLQLHLNGLVDDICKVQGDR